MGHAVLLTGPERRRRWSLEDRAQILAEAFAPGAVVSEVARRFEISTGPASSDAAEPAVCVDFPSGVKVRIGPAAPCELAAAVMRALK